MKQKLFKITVYGLLTYSLVNGAYLALPVEIQEMIPQYNNLVALIGGGASALLGLGGLKVEDYVSKAKTESTQKYNLLATHYIELTKKFEQVAGNYVKIEKGQAELKKEIQVNNKLLKIDLQAKLSNPMIDAQIEKLIEEALDE